MIQISLNNLKKGASFFTNKNLQLTVLEYNTSRELVLFKDYEDVDIAKKLTNQELYVTHEQTRENCNLKENEFFWFDLMDCDIYENDLKLGKVKDIHRYPINDYLEISTSNELIKKDLPATFLLPYIFNTYILNVDTNKKRIDVKDAFVILENS